ncbi:efflux RND transporter permease subunit [Microlunatus parietis]|uniref:HAE1 family hydrophobic/amphiphilic exporter-1 n=1 Tax=Microlunatus parietis TaxID=682979 RepID=A0A7Y9IE64_9ACTN|nr:efflux RND transporter permease subunit [Microlunatus parietis]NYE75174.1 HAE1 family hydrophobic/amphiphilic exporter-1 [Microlunatus parietis]
MALLTRLSLINRLVVALISLAIIVFGVIATTSLKQELLPSITAPQAVVIVQYPGAAPDIVADDAAAPLEQAVRNVSGVTQVDSVSSTNSSQITVMWEYGLDDDKVLGEINSAVSATKSTLPEQVTTEVFAGSTDDIPVIQLAVASDLPLDKFGPLVDDVAVSALKGLPGVRDVTLSGQDTKELAVTLDQKKLDDHELTAQQVNQTLEAQLSVLPAGTTYRGGTELSVEVGAAPGSVDAVKKLAIATSDGPVRLSEIAEVKLQSVARSSIARAEGRPSLGLAVMKTPDADTVRVSHAVQAALPGLQTELGNNASFSTVFDQAPMIEQSLHDLAVEGGLGLVFAIIVILLFLLSARSTLITAISIPLSLLIAMVGLWIGQYSLNLFTLAALTVAVGRVVDDSIVVVENIKRHSLGMSGRRLSIDQVVDSVKEVAGAVTASTLTTIAVFLPVAFVTGSTGELFRPFAVTVAIALAASLLVSLTIVPLLAFWFFRGRKQKAGAAPARAEENPERVTPLQKGYLPVLNWTLRHPVITLIISFVIFLGTLGASTLLKTDFLGSLGDDRALQINQELPSGTRLETTAESAAKIEKVLADDPDVKSYQSTIGQPGEANVATYSITLTDEADAGAATDRIREQLAAIPDAGEVRVTSATAAYTSNDVTVTLTGDDQKQLDAAAAAVQAAVAGVPGLTDVRTDLSEQRPVLRVQVDQQKAADYGFTQAEIGAAVAGALRGTPIGEVTLDGETHDLVLRTFKGTAGPEDIEQLKLPVSQLQQQKAQEKAQDELEKKSDALEKRQEDLQERQKDLQETQKDQSDEAKREAEEQTEDQRRDLEESRDDAQESLADLRDQLRELRNSPEPPPPAPPSPGQPPGPGGLPVTQEQLAWQKQMEQRAQAIAQLQAAVEQAEQALEQIDEQLEAMDEQQEKSDEQTQDQEELADEQERIADLQEELADDQKKLAEEQQDLADLKAGAITVGSLAKVVEQKTPITVKHVDGQRAVTITATPTGSDLGAVSAALMTAVNGVELPPGIAQEQGGASAEQQEAFVQLGLAMLLAIVLVFIIMVATFRSLLQPLILLVSIPFAATGALVGLLATNTALGVPAMVGLLMLIGIVVTNAIVLIDLINTYRERGAEPQAAIVDGARLRLRPIIMTAAATICALTPMAFGLTGGGVFISRPLAVVVIGGLVSSTILTLILVPVLYSLVSKIGYKPPAQPAAEQPATPPEGGPDHGQAEASPTPLEQDQQEQPDQPAEERDTVFPLDDEPRRDGPGTH